MKTLCIVPCGRRQVWDNNPEAGRTEAQYVYIGPFATRCREYAERFYPDSWCILSAQYGFLFPNDIVPGPYNANINEIIIENLSDQVMGKGLNNYKQIVVLGGRNYVQIVNKVFSSEKICDPLRGLRIGYMMHTLNEAIRNGKPLETNCIETDCTKIEEG